MGPVPGTQVHKLASCSLPQSTIAVEGWTVCSIHALPCVVQQSRGTTHKGHACCYLPQAVELPLKAAQTAAVLEVVHSAVGLVRSPVFITGTQVAGRGSGHWVVAD